MDLMSTKGTQTPRDVGVRFSPWMAKMRRSSAVRLFERRSATSMDCKRCAGPTLRMAGF